MRVIKVIMLGFDDTLESEKVREKLRKNERKVWGGCGCSAQSGIKRGGCGK